MQKCWSAAILFILIIFCFANTVQANTILLRLGSRGEEVRKLQEYLIEKGFLDDVADGIFGPKTESAVVAFQGSVGIKQDGIAGPVTLAMLYESQPQQQSSQTEEVQEEAAEPTENVQDSGEKLMDRGSNDRDVAELVIELAKQYLGKPYVYRGSGPDAFDCSGFTSFIFSHFGISLPRSAKDQGYGEYAPKVGREDLKPGDLVFFNTNPNDGDLSDHAGIYIGDGKFIHASSSNSNGRKVVISPMDSGYYQRVFSWGRRVLK